MKAASAWVIGRGGLLGSAVERALALQAWQPEVPLRWSDAAGIGDDLRLGLATFTERYQRNGGESSWRIFWCAGAGIVGTSKERLAAETRTFRDFLELLAAHPVLSRKQGQLFLASSAGGIYGGSRARPITEAEPPRPISDYGGAKLEQEALLASFAERVPTVRALVGRISNLYGPRQRLDKPQGLISHMARCSIYNVPVHIFVPLDTVRDYLFSEDAGARVVRDLEGLSRATPELPRVVTKIYASERAISIAGLVGVFRSLAKRRLRLVSGVLPVTSQQPAQLTFRSEVDLNRVSARSTSLLEGVASVYQSQLELFRQGRLAPPPTLPVRR